MMTSNDNSTIPDRPRPGLPTTATTIDAHQDGVEKYVTDVQKKKDLNLAKQEVVIGTWNVRTLNIDGKLNELEYELTRYQWNIISISEMRWLSTGELVTGDRHKVWWSGSENKHEKGVGFIVHKTHTRSVLECEPISDRVIRLRMSANPRNLSIVQVYAPTSDSSEEDLEAFYEEIKTTKKLVSLIEKSANINYGSMVNQIQTVAKELCVYSI